MWSIVLPAFFFCFTQVVTPVLYLHASPVHIFIAGVRMCVERPLKEAIMVDTVVAVPDKGVIGKAFKKDAKAVQEALAALTKEEAERMDKTLTENG